MVTQDPPGVCARVDDAYQGTDRLTFGENDGGQSDRVGGLEKRRVVGAQKAWTEPNEKPMRERLGVKSGAELEVLAAERPELRPASRRHDHRGELVRAAAYDQRSEPERGRARRQNGKRDAEERMVAQRRGVMEDVPKERRQQRGSHCLGEVGERGGAAGAARVSGRLRRHLLQSVVNR